MKYKKFNTEYDRLKLLSLFNISEKQGSIQQYLSAVGYSTESLPCMDIFSRTLNSEEYGLSKLVTAEIMHAKPNNNGLIIFPITNNISIEFEDGETFLIDTPIAINGKERQKLSPAATLSLFFAIKIPSDVPFEDAISLLP
jgi:hypothetical protein